MRALTARSLVAALTLVACDANASSVMTVEEAWLRATGEGANGAAYLTIANPDSISARLDSVTADDAVAAELHETVLVDGIARMTPLAGLDVPAHGRLQMEPGGAHIMLVELRRVMNTGDSLPIHLHFSNGRTVNAFVQVRAR